MLLAGLLQEGRSALDRGSWDAARQAFESALQGAERPDALEGLGWALFWLDRVDESLAARERAFVLYREAGALRDAARVAYELALDNIELRGEAPATGWLERGRSLLEGLEPGPEHAWLALWEGHFALVVRRDPAVARERGRAALELARAHGLSDLAMLASALEGLVLVAEGQVEDGMRRLDEATAAALSGEISALSAVGATCCMLVHACERVRDYARAAQWGARVERFSLEWGIGPALAVCRTQHAAMLIGRGEWEKAESELRAANERLERSRPLLAVEGLEQLGELRRRQGRWDEAEALFARAEGRSLPLLGRALIAFDRGDAAGAADLLERFLRRTPPDNWTGRAGALSALVRVRLALDQDAEAARALEVLARTAERVGTPIINAVARQAEGLYLAARGEWAEAQRCLEDAVDSFLASQAPFEAAQTRLDLVRCLRNNGRQGVADDEARAALEAFRRLGADREAARAKAAAAPAPPSSAAPSALTGRELEVLRLVARGLGDKEIAAQLNLSGHTVHRHISNIRTKLGLPSRAAAVAWAARNGVL